MIAGLPSQTGVCVCVCVCEEYLFAVTNKGSGVIDVT